MSQKPLAPTSSLVRSPSRILLRVAVLGLSTIAVLALVEQILVHGALARHLSDARLIDTAGRQRMLSERLYRYAAVGDPRQALTLAELESAHRALSRRPENSNAVTQHIQRTGVDLERFRVALRSGDLQQASNAQSRYVESCETLVAMYGHESNSRLASTRRFILLLLLVAFVVLAGVFLFVLRPAARLLDSLFGELRNHRDNLERLVAERTLSIEEESRAKAKALDALAIANERLEALAGSDPLTGIANRRRFDETLLAEWRRARRSASPISLILLDVDHFKLYNDRLGHPAGDACLAKIGQTLNAWARRPADLAARIGGEEFALIMPDTPREGSLVVAELIRKAVFDLQLSHAGSPVAPFATVSIGVACAMPDEDDSSDALLKSADRALYYAKSSGRNRVATDPAAQSAPAER